MREYNRYCETIECTNHAAPGSDYCLKCWNKLTSEEFEQKRVNFARKVQKDNNNNIWTYGLWFTLIIIFFYGMISDVQDKTERDTNEKVFYSCAKSGKYETFNFEIKCSTLENIND